MSESQSSSRKVVDFLKKHAPAQRKLEAKPEKILFSQKMVAPPRASLLGLPGELRNAIYFYLTYLHHSTIPIVYGHTPFLSNPLFQLNRQLRSEAMAFICARKELYFHSPRTALLVLPSFGPTGLANLKRLHIVIFEEDLFSAESSRIQELRRAQLISFLQRATSLNHLKLELHPNPGNALNMCTNRLLLFISAFKFVKCGEIEVFVSKRRQRSDYGVWLDYVVSRGLPVDGVYVVGRRRGMVPGEEMRFFVDCKGGSSLNV